MDSKIEHFYVTSGTPEVCQLPAGMAEKNKLVLYPLVCDTKKQY